MNMKSEHDIKTLRHSAAHLLAHAVIELFPDTILTIGPATEDGFFYDLLPAKNFKEEDLVKIEKRMHQLVEQNIPLEHTEIPKDKAREIFAKNPFKLELIDQIPGDTVGLATQGNFYDLCRGGHVPSTGYIKYFKLTGISGSYWRASRDNQALQRISGTAFFTLHDLQEFEKNREEIQMYDHRRLGKQLDLFSFHEEGVGFPFFHPKGKRIVNTLIAYMRKIHDEYNYQEISTPTVLSAELWKQSGHYAYYKDNMYFTQVDDQSYAIKPMNCPGSILVYKNRPHSYRELPFKLAEFGHDHRHELSGVLHGLMRVRAFTMDDTHIYCTVEQIEQEVRTLIEIITKVLKRFDFAHINFAISTRPEKSMGDPEVWEKATSALRNALDHAGIPYKIKEGEGAFYGPKIEVVIQDSMKREWQCSTVQIDFQMPENFDLSYVTSAGTLARPVMIHQAIYGSLERFFAILLEHYKGHLPFWLAPIQARVLPITEKQEEYAKLVTQAFKKAGIRVELDQSSDPLAGKIKAAQTEKIPWMIVVGGREAEQNAVTIRYADGKQEPGIALSQAIEMAHKLNGI
jgi:threonyl-tRNA synthetase